MRENRGAIIMSLSGKDDEEEEKKKSMLHSI